jgi:hypothetical protein
MGDSAGFGVAYFFLAAIVFLIAVLWILLPFAVFGIKDELRKQHAELKALHASTKIIADYHGKLLKAIEASVTATNDDAAASVEPVAPPLLSDSPDLNGPTNEAALDAAARLRRDRWRKGAQDTTDE